jgi:hypothetical protein
MNRLDHICQIVIVFTSISQAWLLTRGDTSLAYYGCIVGLIGSPFWLYTSIKNKQLGIFIIAIWYAICYSSGLWR